MKPIAKHGTGPRPTEAPGAELEARRLQRLQTAEMFRGRRTSLTVIEAAASASERADALIAEQTGKSAVACREGCNWCCHKVVGTTPAEVFRIAAYLREQLTAAALAEVKARIEEVVARRSAPDRDRWATARLPCPLLADGRCTVYPVRPLTCRGYNSRDARACERSVKSRGPVEVPVGAVQQRLATFILDGLRAGMTEVGIKVGELVDLARALKIALEGPETADRWLAGDLPFTAAELPGGR